MERADATPGLWVKRGGSMGFLRQEANGWDVLCPDGTRHQGVDLSEWSSAQEPEPPPLVEKRTRDGLKAGAGEKRGGDQ